MHKIFGYLLIGIGLLFIMFAALSMYKVCVDRQPVAPIVQLADMNINTQYGIMQMPMQNVNTMANIMLFVAFMLFLVSAGAKLANIGNGLLKTERIYDALIQLKSKNELTAETFKKL